jgi:anti-anti-sigma regulatory factor
MNRAEFKVLGSTVLIEFSGRSVIGEIDVVTDTGEELKNRPGAFKDHLMQLMENGNRRFVADMTRYRIDTAALGELVGMYKRIVSQRDGWFGIVSGSKQDGLFAATKLDTVFLLFDDQKDAIAAAEAWDGRSALPPGCE